MTPLEVLRSRWQSAAEALCAHHALNPSLLGVVVSELLPEATGTTAEGGGVGVGVSGGGVGGGEGVQQQQQLPAGVQHFRQVQDWVVTTAAQAHRMV